MAAGELDLPRGAKAGWVAAGVLASLAGLSPAAEREIPSLAPQVSSVFPHGGRRVEAIRLRDRPTAGRFGPAVDLHDGRIPLVRLETDRLHQNAGFLCFRNWLSAQSAFSCFPSFR